ncbi:MAG: hypothetical protein KDK28_00455 [Maritimibacter sp.]|nr:hypothetical protein [Maritimibacter sp.]
MTARRHGGQNGRDRTGDTDLRHLILILATALTVLVSTGAGVLAFDMEEAAGAAPMTHATLEDCADCQDHAHPAAHGDHRLCGDCAACGVTAVEMRAPEVTAAFTRMAVLYPAVPAQPAAHPVVNDPPPPRV